MNPDIPEPFVYPHPLGSISDMGIEGDGDLVFATESGLHLFSPYGKYKRRLADEILWGIASCTIAQDGTELGVMAVGPGVSDCRPTPYYDDQYLPGGMPYATYDAAWWAGEADPYYPLTCWDSAGSSSFQSCETAPQPIAYHPATAVVYQKVVAPDCVADDTCEWPYGNLVPGGGDAILAYHPDAPLRPDYTASIFEGSQDFLVYYDYPIYSRLQTLATTVYQVVPACLLHSLYIIWDITNPPPSGIYMSHRDGVSAATIGDFEFDALNRLIMVLPNGDSVAITEPVVFPEPIIIQQILGGRQNGMGTLPGEFYHPVAVAIDPRNQNILVSEQGNGRVQTFDSNGNFIREFGSADPSLIPGAIRVDAFGAIYVANINPDRCEGDDLRIYSEYGAMILYGAIAGWVRDKNTHEPIDHCGVRVETAFVSVHAVTDRDGYFIFPSVAAGNHNLVADKEGYKATNTLVFVIVGQTTHVDMYLD